MLILALLSTQLTFMFKLPDSASVFTSEAVAMLEAFKDESVVKTS